MDSKIKPRGLLKIVPLPSKSTPILPLNKLVEGMVDPLRAVPYSAEVI